MLPLMSLREHVKSRLTKDQRKRVLRAIVAVRVFFDAPRRAFNRASIERRLPALPGGRGWRTAIPPALHRLLQLGILDYRYRGVQMGKHPFEIALYMRLIGETKPGTIIEIGTESGG